jgi:CspA family cold shock protein
LKGTVKKWLSNRGYGFIDAEEGDEDVFIHHSEIQGTYDLKEGQEVEFEIESTDKGPRAVGLKVIE